jgi:DHA1 family tetracycline resistance protein-like MFS transporter
MQGLASNNIGANQQGELQGGIESAMSLTAIISPILMTQTFGYFTSSAAPSTSRVPHSCWLGC